VTPDTFVVIHDIYQERGMSYVPYFLAHDFVMDGPFNKMAQRLGIVRANPENTRELFAKGRKVFVYPGGDVDALRPFRMRNKICFDGRQGYIRMALEHNVPIVPIVAAGAHGAVIVIDDLPKVVKAFKLKQRMRMNVLPLVFSLPFGLTLGMPLVTPLPFPVKIRVKILRPIYFDRHGLEAAADKQYVDQCAEQVESAMQLALDQMTAKPSKVDQLLRKVPGLKTLAAVD